MAPVGRNAADPPKNYGDLGVAAASRNVTPQAPVRLRQITPRISSYFLCHIHAGILRERVRSG